MLAIIIAAVLGAAVGALTTASLKWGRTTLAVAKARLQRDHRSLHGGGNWMLPQSVSSGQPCSVRLLIACAPSRSIRKSDLDPDRAIPFIRQSFPDMFLEEPSLSLPQQGVKFTVASGGSPSDGFAWAWANGRVDLAVDSQLDCGPDQRFAIPVVDVLRPIAMMAAAVSGPGYSKVYGKTRTHLLRRFDWFIGVSMTYTHPGAYTIAWDDITFPGRRPPRAGSGQGAYCPPGGYAAAKLRNWKAGSPVENLLAIFLEDFLKQNGYHDVGDAITDTVAAAAGVKADAGAPCVAEFDAASGVRDTSSGPESLPGPDLEPIGHDEQNQA
jgi:hypothetical protein